MIIEGAKFVLHTLKFAVNPYPELISDGWSHTEASMWMWLLYVAYFMGFALLIEMYRERIAKEIN